MTEKVLPSQQQTIQAITAVNPADNEMINGSGHFFVDWFK